MLTDLIDVALGLLKNTWNSDFKFLLVIILAPLLQLFIKLITPFLIKILFTNFGFKKNDEASKKRVKTLAGVIEATTFVFILVGVILFIFSELGLEVAPLIAGAGILSLAVGFGAQSLVKDVISGIFIILENQFNKGDWVKIGKYEGKVIKMNLRRTVLQTFKGSRHIIPNSQVAVVTNNTNQYSAISLVIPLKVGSDFKKANRLIDEACKELSQIPDFEKALLETPQAVGVDEINEFAAMVRIWGKAKPGKHIKIRRELASKIAEKFSQNKIKLPGKIIS